MGRATASAVTAEAADPDRGHRLLATSGSPYIEGTRAELARRLDAVLAPLGIPAPGGQDSMYYALIDVLAVARARRGKEFARWLAANVGPEQVPLQLAREHGVIVLPGQIFDAERWAIRVSLASLTADELTVVGAAIVEVLDSFG